MKTKLSLLAICLILIAPLVLSGCKEPEAPANNDTPANDTPSIEGTWFYFLNYEAGQIGPEYPACSAEKFKLEIKDDTFKMFARNETEAEFKAFWDAIKNGTAVPESKWEPFPMYEGIISIDENKVSFELLFFRTYYNVGDEEPVVCEYDRNEVFLLGTINENLSKIIINKEKYYDDEDDISPQWIEDDISPQWIFEKK